ncbi:MAG: class I SAM-dependent methyltransferase [Selenomonas sp.]|nr:class I SAM-dependent methyltransferase [Selenomonas sp.]
MPALTIQPSISEAFPADALLEHRIETYWDERSRAFSEKRRRELDGPDARAWKMFLLRTLDPVFRDFSSLRVLDVGTGAGFFAILFGEMGAHATGLDLSRDMIHEAKVNSLAYGVHAETEFLVGNAQELPFEDASFDIVISRNLTWTLPDVPAAYCEWARVLKPGGMLFNFDSDHRHTVWDTDNTNDGLAKKKLAECNAIKNALAINRCVRPAWDCTVLEELGFAIQTREDIRHDVFIDPTVLVDDIPLFAICGRYGVPSQS